MAGAKIPRYERKHVEDIPLNAKAHIALMSMHVLRALGLRACLMTFRYYAMHDYYAMHGAHSALSAIVEREQLLRFVLRNDVSCNNAIISIV